MVLAVTELKQAIFLLGGGERAGRGRIDAYSLGGQSIDAYQGGVQLLLDGGPGGAVGQSVEHVSEAIIVKIESANGFSEDGGEHFEALAGPGFELRQAVVTGGDELGEPDGSDLAEGQLAGPVRIGWKVPIQQCGQLHALQLG